MAHCFCIPLDIGLRYWIFYVFDLTINALLCLNYNQIEWAGKYDILFLKHECQCSCIMYMDRCKFLDRAAREKFERCDQAVTCVLSITRVDQTNGSV